MGKTHSIAVFSFMLIMLVLLGEIQALSAKVSASDQPRRPDNQSTFGSTEGSLNPQDCAPRCSMRCSATSHKKPCLFFCNKCCAKCLCVPAGTYGNKQSCPCYNRWKTQTGGPKCP